jgi:hypothetical protein
MLRLGFGLSQRAFEIHELAGCRRAKAMHAAPLDAQLIASLAHVPLKYPNVAYLAALTKQLHLLYSTSDTVSARRCSTSVMRAPIDKMKRSAWPYSERHTLLADGLGLIQHARSARQISFEESFFFALNSRSIKAV